MSVLEKAASSRCGRDYLAGGNRKPHSGRCDAQAAIPLEVLTSLPLYFCDYRYLHILAATSTSMLASTRRKRNWDNRDVDLDNQQDLLVTQRLRSMAALVATARSISVNLHQLSMFLNIPQNVRLCWNVEALPPQIAFNSFKFGCISTAPLMGCADFHVFLPDDVRGLYVGVKEFRGERKSYCRIDNVFQDTITWSMGVNQHPVMPHRSASRHAPRPNAINTFQIRWNDRNFAIALNGEGVSHCRLRQEHVNGAAPPLSDVVFMAFGRGRYIPAPLFLPLSSPIQLNSQIQCGICNRYYPLDRPRWSVCPLCNTWICSTHCERSPSRRCPHCVMQLSDYLGGSEDAMIDAVVLDAYRRGLYYSHNDLVMLFVLIEYMFCPQALILTSPGDSHAISSSSATARVSLSESKPYQFNWRLLFRRDYHTCFVHSLNVRSRDPSMHSCISFESTRCIA